jgi:hypothetical protein
VKELTLRDNPYVGLRPFFERDSLYFFGREQQSAELLELLHQHRFVGVVGSSGSGKSSLVRAGLLPKLLGGFLAQDRDRWCIVRMKPGDAPMGNLATALLAALDEPSSPEARRALEQRLRDDHTDALIARLEARVERNANVLVLVDQFEEIFAFRGGQEDDASGGADPERRQERARRRAEAADFVDLLLEAARRSELPIYVTLAMRTDFLGECDLFYGLPEALNRGRYLVPRLTRQQLREAIDGPATLLGARIEPRLLDHLLNELGDRFDRLPVLQHALLRTWDAWRRAGGVGAIDFQHYEAAGRLDRALDRDAEGALRGLDPGVVSAMFRRLTDTDVRQRRVRSPARISVLTAIAGGDRGAVERVVQRFEEDGRSFVYRADDGQPDDPRVDISHESLIRQWDRLRAWVDDERRSRDQYRELVVRARKQERGEAALLQDPELRMAVDWRERSHPSPAWASRYADADGDFASAVGYLDASVASQCHTLAEAELARRWRIWNPLILAVMMTVALLSETWLARSPTQVAAGAGSASSPIEGTASAPRGAVRTLRVDDLDWTIDDRGQALDWSAAGAYCYDLTVGPRTDWRLPAPAELLDLYDRDAPATGGPKLKAPFRDAVTARWIWSNEPGEQSSAAFAADFSAGMFVPLPVDFAGGARALCVSSPLPANRAGNLAARRAGVRDVVSKYAPLGVFVLAYLVLAWLGRRWHRRWALPRILRGIVASGGRSPGEAAAKTSASEDATAAHKTTYGSTVRRAVGYTLDLAIHLGCLFVAFAVVVIVQDVPVIVTLPSGQRIEGVLHETDDTTVSLTTADGAIRSFPLNRGPSLDVIGGVPVPATLPSGARVEGRSFEKLQVVVTLPSLERIEGTLEERADDHVSLTTAEGVRRSFPLDPNQPDVEIWWPPSDGAIVGLLIFGLAFGWLYDALQLSSQRQATIGMRVAGVFRTGLHGERLSFGRASAWYGYRLLSYLAYLLGFVIQPFTRRRQTFHDWMAGSVVLRRPTPDPAPR